MARKENLYRPGRHPSRRRIRKKRLAAWRAADAQAKAALVVSHADCLDGVGSAAVALRALGPDQSGVVYAHPDGIPEVLEHFAAVPGRGRRMLVTDLSLQRPDLEPIVQACHHLQEADWKVEWRDHHGKQWEGLDLEPLRSVLEVLEVDVENHECGCSLLQKALAPHDDFLRRLAHCVRDRDLWKNRDPDSETLEFALADLGTDAFSGHLVRAHDGDPVVTAELAEAAARERAHQETVKRTLLAQARFFGESPRRVGIVYGWLPKNTGLHDLIEEHGCAVAVNLRPNGKMSLRSHPKAPVCHLVAQEFKGGGHPNASGGDLGFRGLRFWWYVLTRGRGSPTERIAESCLRHLAAVLPAERGAGKAEAKGHAGKPAAKPVAKAPKPAPKRKATGKAAASKKSRRGA